jgi:hypothetical protein
LVSGSDLELTTSNPNPGLTGSNPNMSLRCKAKLDELTANSVTIPVATTEFDNSVAGAESDESSAIAIPFNTTLTSITSGTSALSSYEALDVYPYALKLGSL